MQRTLFIGKLAQRTAAVTVIASRVAPLRANTTVHHFTCTTTPHRLYSSTSQSKQCPQCSSPQPISQLVCTKPTCGALQIIPSSLSAFDLLGLNVQQAEANGWRLDLAKLKSAWRSRIGTAHPDRARGRGQIAEAQSAALNRAYQTLRRPLQRAHLLLQLHGYTAPAEDEGVDDSALLMQVMELREALEEATNEEQVNAVRRENDEYMQATLAELDRSFSSTPPQLDAARLAALKLRYWTNIDQACQEWSGVP